MMRMRVAPTFLYGLVGFAVVAGTISLYLLRGGQFPDSPSEWANFGTYVGGLAGPMLSFVALVAVARTMSMQNSSIELEQARQRSDQHVRWLDELYRDIREARTAKVSIRATLGEVLDGEVPVSAIEQGRLEIQLRNFLKLVAHYCKAVAIYRDNVSEYYDIEIYADRGARALDSIKPLCRYLDNMGQPAIEFCDMHLRGDTERRTGQAMSRSSRQ